MSLSWGSIVINSIYRDYVRGNIKDIPGAPFLDIAGKT
jgi:hypothetical protein